MILVLLGLVLDALLSTVIGEHAFAFSIVGWIANSKFKRFSFFSMEQQMVVIGLLTLTYQLIILIIDSFLGFSIHPVVILGCTLINILIWPWIRLLGEEILRKGLAKSTSLL